MLPFHVTPWVGWQNNIYQLIYVVGVQMIIQKILNGWIIIGLYPQRVNK